MGGVALAGFCCSWCLARRRRLLRGAALMLLLGLGLGMISGCSGTVKSVPVSNVVKAGTTAGTYTVTVTGTSGGLSVTDAGDDYGDGELKPVLLGFS